MSDYKQKYEELLESCRKLELEIALLRTKNSNKHNNQVQSNASADQSSLTDEIIGTISSYAALFRVSDERKITVIDLNAKAEEVECVNRDDIVGKQIEVTPLETRSKLIELIYHVYITGDAHKLATSVKGDDSEGFYMGFVLTTGDILITWEPGMQQKYREDILRQELIFRTFAEMIPEIIFEIDLEGKIIYGNKLGLELFELTTVDLQKGIFLSDIFPDRVSEVTENLKTLIRPDQVLSNEYCLKKKDGTEVPIMTHCFATFHRNKLTGYRGIVRDISRQKRYEEQITRENAYLEHIIDSTPEAISITDRHGKVSKINKEFTNLFGYSPEEVLHKDIDDLIVPEELKDNRSQIEALSSEKQKINRLTIRKNKNGNKIYVSELINGITVNNDIVAYLGIYRDVSSERKSQLIQEILYNISTTALNQQDIRDIYHTIVNELSKIWDTSNFFIALFDKETEMLSLPIFSDEKDSFYELPARKTITRWVINLKKPVLLKENDLRSLESSGQIDLVGAPCKVWMGIPLKADKEIIGVMCLQDYHDENKFSQEDVNVLEFISNQIAIAIQRRMMLDNVIMASRKAEEAAQSKQQFMSTMSHEIRTPLNEVIGITNLLLQGKPREDQMEYLKTLRFSGNHLLTLVNDVLDYNKMESGKIIFEQTQFNLNDFLNDIMRTYSYRSKAKNLVFDIIKESELPEEVIGDPIRLNQIMSNLLSNALKFTENGSIYVIIKELQRNKNRITTEFSVKDTGLGIPKERQDIIFESFTQASPDTTRHYGGTGLGLAICKKLIELQGGNIDVESEPGKGSTFRFSISFGISEEKIQSKKETAESYTGLEGKKILMAEDNRINFFVANKFLISWGVNVTHAENGKIALEILEKEAFDLVIMDLHMPIMDGIEATRQIRNSANPKIKSIPVVALTAAIMSESHDKIEDLNINDYVLKPFKPKDLFDKIIRNIR